MNKKILIIVGIALLVLIGVFAFASLNKNKGTGSVILGSLTNEKGKIGLSEKERFAKMQAEFLCDLTTNSQENTDFSFSNSMESLESYASKYGFDMDEIASLQAKYSRDSSFQELILKNMKDFCPEIASKLEAER